MIVLTKFRNTSSSVRSFKSPFSFMDPCNNTGCDFNNSAKKHKHKLISTGPNETTVPKKIMKTKEIVNKKMDLNRMKDSIRSKCNVTFLEEPTISESDKKQYLVMKLSNGLTALLISDVNNLISLDPTETTNPGKNEVVDSESEEGDSHGTQSSSSDDDEEDETDDDSKEKLAACALTVRAGSFSDPENIPGLAHFLEHMVFMGSEKFPKENDFDAYISTRGGSTNASTECEYTTFYFECPDKHLVNAMDRFANFFVSPLMKRDSMSREREAVESEFKSTLFSDSSRMEQLFCSSAPLSNPAHKFMWGNLITLQQNVSDDELYSALKDFWKTKYSANLMTVAVQARLPLDVLGTNVNYYFSSIPSYNLPINTFPVVNTPFDMDLFNKIYTVMPVKDTNRLQLTWAFPSVIHLYKSKPLSYLSFLIGHEGEGSLLSYFQEKLWALQITAGSSDSGIENNSIYSLFSIDINLTDEGLKHFEQIVMLVFSYIELLKQERPSESLFKEAQIIEEMQFRFQHEVESSDYVESLSINMQLYPPVDYVVGDKLLFEFKPDEIENILSLMTPDNVNIMILSKSASEKVSLDRTEKWFNTKYKLDDITNDLYSKWKNCKIDPKLFLPKPNIYIPCDFNIIAPASNPPEHPKNICKNKFMEVWFKQDIKFKLPYGYIKIYMISPIAASTPQNAVMCNMFISLFSLFIVKETYPASLAGLSYSLSPGDSGIILTINGFNQKIALLLKKVLTEMISFARSRNIPEGLFEAVKEQQRKGYYNGTLKASKLANDLRLSILCTHFWGSVSKLEAIPFVTIESCQQFNINFFENLYVKCLVQGNISEEQATDLSCEIKEIIDHKSLLAGTYPQIQTRVLPTGENIIRVQSFNKQDTNCNVTNYYQCGLNYIEDSCMIEILLLIMEEPLFDTLRTQEQLAYDVNCEIKDTQGVLGFTITVKSQAEKFSVEYVENRITNFLNKLKTDLENMSSDDFNQIKESLKILKLQDDTHLKDDVQRNWAEIVSDEYLFDRIKREVKSIDKINLSDLNQYFKLILNVNENNNYLKTSLRKLSVQVDAEGHPITETNIVKDELKNNNVCSDFKTSLGIEIKKSKDENVQCKFIEDIERFKSALYIFPYFKCYAKP